MNNAEKAGAVGLGLTLAGVTGPKIQHELRTDLHGVGQVSSFMGSLVVQLVPLAAASPNNLHSGQVWLSSLKIPRLVSLTNVDGGSLSDQVGMVVSPKFPD